VVVLLLGCYKVRQTLQVVFTQAARTCPRAPRTRLRTACTGRCLL